MWFTVCITYCAFGRVRKLWVGLNVHVAGDIWDDQQLQFNHLYQSASPWFQPGNIPRFERQIPRTSQILAIPSKVL